jgi:hypothetical protein
VITWRQKLYIKANVFNFRLITTSLQMSYAMVRQVLSKKVIRAFQVVIVHVRDITLYLQGLTPISQKQVLQHRLNFCELEF